MFIDRTLILIIYYHIVFITLQLSPLHGIITCIDLRICFQHVSQTLHADNCLNGGIHYSTASRRNLFFAPYVLWSHFRVVTILFSGKTFNLFIQFVHTENLKPVWNLYILFVLSYPCRGNGQCAKILKRLFKIVEFFTET